MTIRRREKVGSWNMRENGGGENRIIRKRRWKREDRRENCDLHDEDHFPGDRFKLILQISIYNLRLL